MQDGPTSGGSATSAICPPRPWYPSRSPSNRCAASKRPSTSTSAAMPSTPPHSRRPLRWRPSWRSLATSPAVPWVAGKICLLPTRLWTSWRSVRVRPFSRKGWTGSSRATTWTGSVRATSRPSAPPTRCAGPTPSRWSRARTTWTAAGSARPIIRRRGSIFTW